MTTELESKPCRQKRRKEGLVGRRKSRGHGGTHWDWWIMKTWGGRKDGDAKEERGSWSCQLSL